MVEAFRSRLLRYLEAACAGALRERHLCAAYSGGLDSTVLLHALCALRAERGFRLSALHVHHGLNPAAEDWVAHCEATCRAWEVPLTVARVDVARDGGKGLEEAARRARHAQFAAFPADWIVLAQHRDDQAETVLHHLLRGSGVAGAAGMPAHDTARRLLRPLLDAPRSELQAYAAAVGLAWIEDDSNADPRFTRNHLRHQVLPLLEARFPAAGANLARAAGHFREADVLLAELAAEDWQRAQLQPHAARAALVALGAARLRNALRGVLRQAGEAPPSAARLDDWVRQLGGEAPLRLVCGAHALCAWQGAVWLEPATLSVPGPAGAWRGETELPWGGGGVVFSPARGDGALRLPTDGSLRLDVRCEGMTLRPRAGGPARSLRKLCQELGIPSWLRDRLPVLWQDRTPVWIGGVGAAAAYLCNEDEPGWRVIWHRCRAGG